MWPSLVDMSKEECKKALRSLGKVLCTRKWDDQCRGFYQAVNLHVIFRVGNIFKCGGSFESSGSSWA